MKDPLVAACTAALEQIFARGVEVTPAGDGWLLKVAPAAAESSADAPQLGAMGRAW